MVHQAAVTDQNPLVELEPVMRVGSSFFCDGKGFAIWEHFTDFRGARIYRSEPDARLI